MTKALENLQAKAAIWVDQMAGMMALADRLGHPRPDLSVYQRQIFDLYSQELELSKVMDSSDLVIHADGPAIEDHKAALGVVAHLFSNVERQFKRLALSVLDLGVADRKVAASKLDFRLTGIAPGSLYAGFCIEPPKASELLGTAEENQMMADVKAATLSVTAVPKSVTDKGQLAEELGQWVGDPVVRDSALLAAYHLSPTGRSGIVSIDFINPAEDQVAPSTLDASHRQLLREVTQKNPLIKSRTRHGSFVGNLTSIDLDKSRVDLRGIGAEGFDSIRCILPALTAQKGREILGHRVRISGLYETTPSGRPSLLQVEQIEVVGQMNI